MIWAHCRQLQHQQLQFTDQTAASFWSRPPPTTSNVLVPGTHRRNHHQAATAVPKRVFDAKEPRRHPVAGEPGSRCRSKPRSGPLRPTIIGVLTGSLLGNADGFPDRHGTPRWRTEICDVLTVRIRLCAAGRVHRSGMQVTRRSHTRERCPDGEIPASDHDRHSEGRPSRRSGMSMRRGPRPIPGDPPFRDGNARSKGCGTSHGVCRPTGYGRVRRSGVGGFVLCDDVGGDSAAG